MSVVWRGAPPRAHLVLAWLAAWMSATGLMATPRACAQLPSFEERRGESVDGWTLERVEQQPEYVRLHFTRGAQSAHMEVNLRAQLHTGLGTRHFSLQPAPEGFAPPVLQERVLAWLREAEEHAARHPAGGPGRVAVSQVILFLQGVLGLALALLVVGGLVERRSGAPAGPAERPNASRRARRRLLGITAIGAFVRVVQGPRIPGFEGGHGTGHGFGDVAAALGERLPRLDPHGNGPAALAQLWFTLWPRSEWALLTLQVGLAALTVPLVYRGALVWLREEREAMWAAALYALYPTAAYFAMTEVRTVPAAFFLLLGLVVAGLGFERRRASWVASGALFSVFAASFHPVVMGAPLVLALFTVSRRDTWPFAGTPPALASLVVAAAAWVILLVLAGLEVAHAAPEAIIGAGGVRVLSHAWRVALPTFGLPTSPFNAFLNVHVTPAVFSVCCALGAWGARQPARRRALLTLLLAALGMTIPGMAGGRYNLARLQHAAAPLYCLLAGVGCVALLQYATARAPNVRLRRITPAALALVLVLSAAATPGPLTRAFVYEGERRVTLRALPSLHASRPCDVYVPPTPEGAYPDAPSYLTRGVLPGERWRTLARVGDVSRELGRSLARDGCAYYFRPSVCWTQRHREPLDADPTALRPECAAVETQLVLTPLHVESVDARPAAAASYRRRRIEIGFFRVQSLAP